MKLITSAEEGGYVFGAVCLSVCPSDYSHTCERILTKFFAGVGHGSRTKWYNLGGNPDHASDTGVQSPKSGSSGLIKKLQTDLCHAVFGGSLSSLSASSYDLVWFTRPWRAESGSRLSRDTFYAVNSASHPFLWKSCWSRVILSLFTL